MRDGCNFVFESVDLMSYHIHKVSLKRGNSYIKSPEWVANKKATINPKNEDNRCFEYSIDHFTTSKNGKTSRKNDTH